MNTLIRVAIVLVLVVVVIVVVRLVARWQKPPHPPIDLDGLGDRPGVVVFTSTDCATCVEAMRIVGGVGAPIREVTWELEPHLFDRVPRRSGAADRRSRRRRAFDDVRDRRSRSQSFRQGDSGGGNRHVNARVLGPNPACS